MTPPPSTWSPSYSTTACPAVTARWGRSKTTSMRPSGRGVTAASASVWLYRVLAVTRMVSAGAAPAIQFTRQAVRRLVNRSRSSPSRMVLSRAFFRTT